MNPKLEGMPFTYWIAPATLVFKNAQSLKFDIDLTSGQLIEIDDIIRETADRWILATQQGRIELIASGYEQYIRQAPSFQYQQIIPFDERNGISLERTTHQQNPNLTKDEIIHRRRNQQAQYEQAKRRHRVIKELEQLQQSHDDRQIELKQFIMKKKELTEQLLSLNTFLQGTIFDDGGK
jgi:hypothetical protein